MKYTDLLPSLLNWPFIIFGLIVIGNLPPLTGTVYQRTSYW